MREDQRVKIAADQLGDQLPNFAANMGLAAWQKYMLWLAAPMILILLCASYALPYLGWVLSICVGVVLSASAVLRYAPVFLTQPPMRLSYHETLSESEYPIYTILVPLFQEAHMLPGLIAHLEAINWPKSRLDIKLVLEQADNETRNAARRLKLKQEFEVLIVPDHPPRTKGKACNYALLSARGQFVAVFDSEDRPDPDQLLRAWHLFRIQGEDVACMQSPLNFFNQNENWLTRQFAIEYMLQFLFFLPFIIRAGLPVFLGGSSNHFRMSALRQICAWDAYNVTEDADIGLRLRRFGFRTVVLPSLTREEAVCRLSDWFKQRSRWIKGWLQTWLVAMRNPRDLSAEIGFFGFIYLQLLVPVYILSLMAHFVIWPITVFVYIADPFYGMLMMGMILFAYLFVIISAQFGCRRTGISELRMLHASCWMIPIYWYLLALAACRAIVQLVVNPYYWDKTTHGISKYVK